MNVRLRSHCEVILKLFEGATTLCEQWNKTGLFMPKDSSYVAGVSSVVNQIEVHQNWVYGKIMWISWVSQKGQWKIVNQKIICGKHFWVKMLVITALCSFLPLTLNFCPPTCVSFFFVFFFYMAQSSLFILHYILLQHYTSNRGYVRTETLFCPSV